MGVGWAGGGVVKRVWCDLKRIKVGMMINRSGVGQFAAGRPEGGILAAKTEWWGKQSGDWLGSVRRGKLASVVERGIFINRLMG